MVITYSCGIWSTRSTLQGLCLPQKEEEGLSSITSSLLDTLCKCKESQCMSSAHLQRSLQIDTKSLNLMHISENRFCISKESRLGKMKQEQKPQPIKSVANTQASTYHLQLVDPWKYFPRHWTQQSSFLQRDTPPQRLYKFIMKFVLVRKKNRFG